MPTLFHRLANQVRFAAPLLPESRHSLPEDLGYESAQPFLDQTWTEPALASAGASADPEPASLAV